MKKYDVAIIGAGPGGYVAAIRASQLGLHAVIIEKAEPGGVCLNWGCIPSKSLIHQAEMFSELPHLREWGIQIDTASFDYSVVHKTSRKAVKKLTTGIAGLLKKHQVDYVTGSAKIKSPQELVIEDTESLHASKIIIATGSRPRSIPGFEFDDKRILSSTSILSLDTLPKELIILGAGAIGIEFAYVMNAFGVKVSVVEMLPQILPLEDADIARVVEKAFTDSGVVFYTDTRATKLETNNSGIKLDIDRSGGEKQTLQSDTLLVAVGRTPNTENLGLENLGIALEKGYIRVGDYNETGVPGIYAIGDVVLGTPQLAHVASKEGEIAVEHIAGASPEAHIDELNVPSAVYCNPQVGSFGLTEEKVKEAGIAYKTAMFSYMGAGKAVAIGKATGLVKIIINKDTKEIIGGHIVGYSATEVIHELLVARTGELSTEELARMIHAHPTISEAVMEGARAVEGWVIHN